MSTDTSAPVTHYDLYIGGAPQPSESDERLTSINPTTGESFYTIPDASAADVDRAVRSAAQAFESPAWRDMTVNDRRRLLLRIAAEIESDAEQLAQLEAEDNGRIIRETRGQVERVVEIWEYFAGWPDKFSGTLPPGESAAFLTYVRPEPVGVVGAIVPWNAPLVLATVKLAAALAAGNTVVMKPSEHTSASLLALMRAFERAGVMPGVVNVVTGRGVGAGEALVSHEGVGLVSFTGGTETGRAIAARAGQRLVRSTLELGGKSPNIVFADADLEAAALGVGDAIFASAGEMCVAGSRCLIEASVYDEVVDRVVEYAGGLRVGDPLDEATDVGPLAFESHVDRVAGYVESGKEEGASVRFGGRRGVDDLPKGFFFTPTVLDDVGNEMRVAQEEIFGPVLCVIPFRDEAEAVRLANDTRFGLTAGVWSENVHRAHRVAGRLDAGWVWVNSYRSSRTYAPFGGFKDSGFGKETGFEAMREMSRLKTVCIQTAR